MFFPHLFSPEERERATARMVIAYKWSSSSPSILSDKWLLPPFGASVLKPGFDLRVRHLQPLGQRGALGGGQVLLLVETLFQLANLQKKRRPSIEVSKARFFLRLQREMSVRHQVECKQRETAIELTNQHKMP